MTCKDSGDEERADGIRTLFEEDIKALTEALISGEICLHDGRKLTDMGLSEGEVHHLAGEIRRFMQSLRSLLLPYLGQMKWLELPLACIYARTSPNTLKKWIEDPLNPLYGFKTGRDTENKKSTSPIVVDRESIDAYYNGDRAGLIEEAIKRLKEAGYAP
jgi:hypothetical protein